MWTDISENPENDGYIISADTLQEADNVLRIFCNAWVSIPNQADHPRVRTNLKLLRRMPKIVMTLKSMQGYRWLDYFIYSQIDDDSYRHQNLIKSTVFPEESSVEARRFFAEQRRVHPRNWGDQQYFDLLPQEPLPFHKLKHRGRGGYSNVYIVQNAFDNKQYALKITTDHGGERAHEHLRNDAEHLKKICNGCKEEQIPHIVRLVNNFSRGHQFGLVIAPAATCNLEQLLLRAAQDPEALRMVRPALLTAIGCLCRTLVYIHEAKSSRHRDIKPQNILFQQPSANNKANFLWSDFGLAKHLGTPATANSTTRGPFQGTAQYAAPEQLKVNVDHGRSADVFSFGCVMFEIVGLLLYQEYSKQNDRFPYRLQEYHKNINRMHSEIDDLIDQEKRRSHPHIAASTDMFQNPNNHQHRRSDSNSSVGSQNGASLAPILKLFKRMTCENAAKRPKAMQVVKELFAMRTDGLELFCPQCVEAVRCNKATFLGAKRRRWYELSPPQTAIDAA